MPIRLEDERKPLPPVVKRTALKQEFYGAVVRVQQRDRLKKDDQTGEMRPVLKPGGKASQELVVTCLTLPGTTAPVGLDGNEFVPEPENLVRLILNGKAFSDWIQAKKELGRPVEVGDVVSQITDHAQVYDTNREKSGSEITDQDKLNAVPRGRVIGIYGPITLRAPKAGSEWVGKAEAAYHDSREPIAAEPATSGGFGDTDSFEPPPASTPPFDEPPF